MLLTGLDAERTTFNTVELDSVKAPSPRVRTAIACIRILEPTAIWAGSPSTPRRAHFILSLDGPQVQYFGQHASARPSLRRLRVARPRDACERKAAPRLSLKRPQEMTSSDTNNDILFSLEGKRVWVAGHNGMVGSALVRRLRNEGCRILTVSRRELDLTRQADTERWMDAARPEIIFVAAGKVGGIAANASDPADFLYVNMMIAMNIMRAAADSGVCKLLWMGSSCIYPKFAVQPIEESALLTGAIEPTNEGYAIAKIAALKLAEAYATQHGVRSVLVMPTNLYGQNDNFDPQTSHVIPALLRRMHEARMAGAPCVTLWGSGNPLREFLHVDDLADACCFVMKNVSASHLINIGSGKEIAIRDLAGLIADIVGFRGEITFDTGHPDGAPRKLLDCGRLHGLGWRSNIDLRQGIGDLYARWSNPGYRRVQTGNR